MIKAIRLTVALVILGASLFANGDNSRVCLIDRSFLLRERYETLMYFNSTCALSGRGIDEGAVLCVDLKIPAKLGGDTSFFNRWVLSSEMIKEKNAFFTNISDESWRYVFAGKDGKTRFYRYAEVSAGLATPDYIMEIISIKDWTKWINYPRRLAEEGAISYAYTNKNFYLRALRSNNEYQKTNSDISPGEKREKMKRLENIDYKREYIPRKLRRYILKRDEHSCMRCGRREGDIVGYKDDGSAKESVLHIDHKLPASREAVDKLKF